MEKRLPGSVFTVESDKKCEVALGSRKDEDIEIPVVADGDAQLASLFDGGSISSDRFSFK